MIEKWAFIPNCNEYYMVSDLGRVKSVDRKVVAKNGAISSLKLGFRGNVQINILESE